ncbi:MAG: RHS repeat-associated core domain-containing protein, partial [Pseudomonadota bacterium]|nr:RHS repeat-associated core domain-containing protein [Pseudomonadota bacterium]
FTLSMGYDTIHNITRKTQVDVLRQPSGQEVTQKKTTYDWTYRYDGQQPHAPTHLGDRTFTYDANGNQLGWTHDQNGTRRSITWDDENRIREIRDNGHRLTYTYDAAGQRLTKRGPQGETGYINQWFTLRNGEVGTKHVYAGTTRVVSKLVKQDKPNSKRKGRIVYEKDQYTYHPDHLGTSAYITHTNGQVYQHLEYFPFGETWVEEHSNKQRTPYLFTAKELDEASQLYYFGARYYDPRTSVWQSADPILGSYLDGSPSGGVYVASNLNLFHYSAHNPVRFRDDNGEWVNFAVGFAVGFVVDVAAQAAVQVVTGQDINIDTNQAVKSGVVGMTGVGLANVASKAVQGVSAARQLGRGTTAALEVGGDVAADTGASVVGHLANDKELSVRGVVGDVVAGQIGGRGASALARRSAASSPTNAALDQAARRAERMADPTKANGSPRRIGRPEARQRQANTARSVQEAFVEGRATRAGIAGSGVVSGASQVYEDSQNNSEIE